MPSNPNTRDDNVIRRGDAGAPPAWVDVRAVARVHATSEDPKFPVAQAFSSAALGGWRAASPGVQTVEVRFYRPRDLSRIRVVFENVREERTQQFTISWSSRRGETHGEVVRQQFNFSPRGATDELEDYQVELSDVETLQIQIAPDIGGRPIVACLTQCQLA
jgi:hypothetical protein